MMIKFEDKQDKTLHFIFAHSMEMYGDSKIMISAKLNYSTTSFHFIFPKLLSEFWLQLFMRDY